MQVHGFGGEIACSFYTGPRERARVTTARRPGRPAGSLGQHARRAGDRRRSSARPPIHRRLRRSMRGRRRPSPRRAGPLLHVRPGAPVGWCQPTDAGRPGGPRPADVLAPVRGRGVHARADGPLRRAAPLRLARPARTAIRARSRSPTARAGDRSPGWARSQQRCAAASRPEFKPVETRRDHRASGRRSAKRTGSRPRSVRSGRQPSK